jgi:hypothetical protein
MGPQPSHERVAVLEGRVNVTLALPDESVVTARDETDPESGVKKTLAPEAVLPDAQRLSHAHDEERHNWIDEHCHFDSGTSSYRQSSSCRTVSRQQMSF